jgi:hypothetical protein
MPDRTAGRATDPDPLPFRSSAPGCAYSVHVHAGQWGSCSASPAVTGVWTSPRTGERWRAFACTTHANRCNGPTWRDVGPLDDTARAVLTDRRDRWAAALAGKGWHPTQPMEPAPGGRRP